RASMGAQSPIRSILVSPGEVMSAITLQVGRGEAAVVEGGRDQYAVDAGGCEILQVGAVPDSAAGDDPHGRMPGLDPRGELERGDAPADSHTGQVQQNELRDAPGDRLGGNRFG